MGSKLAADPSTTPDDSVLTPADLPSAEPSSNGVFRIDKYFRAMTKYEASDLHLKAGTPPKFRINGDIRNIDARLLSNEEIESMVFDLLDPGQIERYHQEGSLDFAHQIEGGDRFRVNLFRQRGKSSLAARRVPRQILSFESLRLPTSLERLADYHQGLVLLAGITGSGKSTTIAAILERINQSRACHIMTIEDPIEFLFEDKKAFINQREIGLDVHNFSDALKYMMREDPDVILIGEMRDHETIAAALAAAETGHLVFGTIHSSSTAGTLARILDMFPEDARGLIRSSLVFNLKAIVCIKLIPSVQKGIQRVPCCEVMLCNTSVQKLIAEERDHDIGSVIRGSQHEGMIDFTESLRQLVDQELVSIKTAYQAAPNPDELKMRLKGISVTSGGIIS